jgi:eukaryotic-like serine/threonine-protein kinase
MAPLPRTFGPYLLLEQLGVGATGEVYLAKSLASDRSVHIPVVIKRMLAERAEDPEFVRRFRHEASVVVQVDSPNVAGVFDVGSVDGALYIAMEYVSGWPMTKLLAEVVAGRVKLGLPEAVEMIGGALEGLRAIHELRDRATGDPLDVVHRDVSPRNLMIGTDGGVRIIDLGIGLSRVQSWQTRTGRVLGSVGYMSPEQIGGKRVDRTADLYAMGVILYELLAGKRFIEPGPAPDMMRAGLRPKWDRLAVVRPDLPQGLDTILDTALGRTPESRYQLAADFAASLYVLLPKESAAGSTRAMLLDRFGAELAAERRKISEILGRAHASEPRGDSNTVVFASGVRFPADELLENTESSDPVAPRSDSGATTEPPAPLMQEGPQDVGHPAKSGAREQDTLELDETEAPATVVIDMIGPPVDQRRVITRVTKVPSLDSRLKVGWLAGLLLLLLGLVLGIASRAWFGF